MTPEIQTLALGATLGAQCMNAIHMLLGYRDERRRDAAARRRRRIFHADAFHSSFRLCQLKNRSAA